MPKDPVAIAAVLRLPYQEADRLVDNPLLQLRYITSSKEGSFPCLTA